MNDPDDGSQATQPEQLPDSIDPMLHDRRARKRRLAIGFGVGVLGLGAAAFAFTRYQDKKERADVATTLGSLRGCLLGGALDDGEIASARFRRIQLVAMGLGEPERIGEPNTRPWPQSCSTFAHATSETLKASGLSDALVTSAEALGKALNEQGSFKDDLTAVVDLAFADADKLGIPAAGDAPFPKPPLASHPLTASFLSKGTAFSPTSFPLKVAYPDAHPAGALRILVEERSVAKAPFLCTFDPSAPIAHCAHLPDAIAAKSGLRLLGTADDDAAPLVFAGNRGDLGVFRADTGELVESVYSYGGYAKKGGASAVLGWDEKQRKPLLSRKSGPGPREQTLFDVGLRVSNYYYDTQLLWDLLLARGVDKNNEIRFLTTKYPWSGGDIHFQDSGLLSEPGLIDGTADEPPHIAGCRSKNTTVVRVKGRDNDALSFFDGKRWSQPTTPELTGGTLSCHGGEAVITRLEPVVGDGSWKTTVAQVHCTAAGCNGARAKMESILKTHLDLGPRDAHVDATDLDGQLLLVWAAGERGGVRMRLGPAEHIDASPDVVLFDDLVGSDGVTKLSSLFDLRLYSREGYAILLLSTVAGVHALRIESGGKVTPVDVVW